MIFRVENGCFGYKEKQILKNISFTVGDGEVLSVLGSNGVGKTTLLKCMMGLLKWNSGHSYVDDQEISQMKHKDFWKKIAYVPQAKGAAFGYSALDMVTLGRSAHLRNLRPAGKRGPESGGGSHGGDRRHLSPGQALYGDERRRASDGSHRSGADDFSLHAGSG